MRLWHILALFLAFYVVAQDGMRILRFSRLDPGAGTFAMSYVRAPQFAPGFVEVTSVFPDGPMGKAGVAKGDHIKFDTDVRNDALPIVGELRSFTLDHHGISQRLQVVAVAPETGLIDSALYTRSLIIALSSFIAALFATFIIWRSGGKPSALLLGVSLAAYSLVNSAPWIGIDSPLLRQLLNLLGRMIQTLSPVAFIGFALLFYAEFVGAVRRIAWQMLALYGALLLALLALSEYLDATIAALPVIGDGQACYTIFRLLGSIAALVCVAVGWRRCRTETQQRYAMLFAALFILVGSRTLYLSHLYLWQGSGGQYSLVQLVLAITGTALAAPLFAYAILKQKVLDLGFAINRTLIYGIISFGVLVTFGLIEWGSERLLPHETLEASAAVNAGVALSIFLVFHRIQKFVEEIIKRLLFRSWHENEARLRRFIREAVFIGKPSALASASVEAITRFAHGADCAVYLRKGDDFARSAGTLADAALLIDGDDPLAVALRADRRTAEPVEAGSSIPAALALAMAHRGELDGFILLGEKPAGDSYRPDEIELLGWAAQQIGLDMHAIKVGHLEKDISRLEMRVGELRMLLNSKIIADMGQKPG